MNDKLNDGGPAFPVETTATPYAPGMSLRAYLAGQVVSGAIELWLGKGASDGLIAQWACETADALIAELSKGSSK